MITVERLAPVPQSNGRCQRVRLRDMDAVKRLGQRIGRDPRQHRAHALADLHAVGEHQHRAVNLDPHCGGRNRP